VPLSEVALIHGDPPYGNGEDAHRGEAKAGKRGGKGLGNQKVYAPIEGNDKPFDPAPLLILDRPTVLWGANHYASRLPDSKAWLVWDKRDSFGSDNGSDCELAWCSFGGTVRQFRHLWRGLCRASESGSTSALYPTQKPIALSIFVFQHAKLKAGDLVFVPCLGSGPDVAAAHQMGLRLIGCDVSKEACDLSVSRLRSVTPERNAEPAGPLFAGLQ
jgi:DNA modification methylase